MTTLHATGPSVAILRWTPEDFARLRVEEREALVHHHVMRLLCGETTAEASWVHAGVSVEVEADMEQGEE